jgi:diadenosine tetraphosphate (Ap4A) HIT family hydrolase
MAQPPCPFCFPEASRIFHAGELVLGLWDGYPVSPGHALLVPRRHVETWFDATAAERNELTGAVEAARAAILRRHRPDGFNIGVNVGAAGGQTVFHLHVHVIPRYAGDVPDPRGGVRHVVPRALQHWPTMASEPGVREEELPWISRSEVGIPAAPGIWPERRTAAEPVASDAAPDVAAFGERILQLLDEGRFTATYKYAVLLGLTELCLEHGGGRPAFTTRQLAEKVVELYWPQTAPYPGQTGARVLAQNRGGQAEIVTLIERFRVRHAPDPTQPLSRARAAARHQYERLVAAVEWKLIEMPLPRLQVIGDTENRFLYRIGWDASVTRQHLGDSGFDNRIQLLDGVADSLVQLSGLLRPLIQRAWAGMVAGMNRDATDEARLQEFLFGAQRVSLDPVRAELRELQGNRCFYCDGRIAGPADVDHFIPWARHPDNGIENLVVADPRCNGNKRDFLAAGEHVERWTQRFTASAASERDQLGEIAQRAGFDRHPERTLNVARTIYTRLPDDVRLWLRTREFVAVAAQRERLQRALGGMPAPRRFHPSLPP